MLCFLGRGETQPEHVLYIYLLTEDRKLHQGNPESVLFFRKAVAAVVVIKNRGHIEQPSVPALQSTVQYNTYRQANTLNAHTVKALLYSHCLEHSYGGGQRGSGSNTHNSSACVTLHPLQLSVSTHADTDSKRQRGEVVAPKETEEIEMKSRGPVEYSSALKKREECKLT